MGRIDIENRGEKSAGFSIVQNIEGTRIASHQLLLQQKWG